MATAGKYCIRAHRRCGDKEREGGGQRQSRPQPAPPPSGDLGFSPTTLSGPDTTGRESKARPNGCSAPKGAVGSPRCAPEPPRFESLHQAMQLLLKHRARGGGGGRARVIWDWPPAAPRPSSEAYLPPKRCPTRRVRAGGRHGATNPTPNLPEPFSEPPVPHSVPTPGTPRLSPAAGSPGSGSDRLLSALISRSRSRSASPSAPALRGAPAILRSLPWQPPPQHPCEQQHPRPPKNPPRSKQCRAAG